MAGFPMPPEIAIDLRAQAMAAIHAWLLSGKSVFDAVVGSDEEAAVLLPAVIGELCSALERLTSSADLRQQAPRSVSRPLGPPAAPGGPTPQDGARRCAGPVRAHP